MRISCIAAICCALISSPVQATLTEFTGPRNLNSDTYTNTSNYTGPDIASNGDTLVATWTSFDSKLLLSTSTNSGASWSTPIDLTPVDELIEERPRIAYSNGTWVLGWIGSGTGTVYWDVHYRQSTSAVPDHISKWSAPADIISRTPSCNPYQLDIAASQDGVFIACWADPTDTGSAGIAFDYGIGLARLDTSTSSTSWQEVGASTSTVYDCHSSKAIMLPHWATAPYGAIGVHPSISVDSTGENWIVTATGLQNSTGTSPTTVFFAKSMDGGINWDSTMTEIPGAQAGDKHITVSSYGTNTEDFVFVWTRADDLYFAKLNDFSPVTFTSPASINTSWTNQSGDDGFPDLCRSAGGNVMLAFRSNKNCYATGNAIVTADFVPTAAFTNFQPRSGSPSVYFPRGCFGSSSAKQFVTYSGKAVGIGEQDILFSRKGFADPAEDGLSIETAITISHGVSYSMSSYDHTVYHGPTATFACIANVPKSLWFRAVSSGGVDGIDVQLLSCTGSSNAIAITDKCGNGLVNWSCGDSPVTTSFNDVNDDYEEVFIAVQADILHCDATLIGNYSPAVGMVCGNSQIATCGAVFDESLATGIDRSPCFALHDSTGHGRWFSADVAPRRAVSVEVGIDNTAKVGVAFYSECDALLDPISCSVDDVTTIGVYHNSTDTTQTVLVLVNTPLDYGEYTNITFSCADAPVMAGGWQHALALYGNGELVGWGANWTHQLGLPGGYRTAPEKLLPGETLKAVGIGSNQYYSGVVMEDGTVRTFGRNSSGQLGTGTTSTLSGVQIVKNQDGSTFTLAKTSDAAIACAWTNMAVAASDGKIYTWGGGAWGSLGDGGTPGLSSPGRLYPAPVKVTGGADFNGDVKQIVGGQDNYLVRLSDGTVWSWGYGNWGAMGTGGASSSVAKQVVRADTLQPLTDVIDVAIGANNAYAVDADSNLWAWGANGTYDLADGTTTTRWRAQRVKANSTTNLTNIARIWAGSGTALAKRNDGALLAWGNNANHYLGVGTSGLSPVPPVQWPSLVALPSGTWCTEALEHGSSSSGWGQTYTLDGDRYCWGWNFAYNLGDGTNTDRPLPVVGQPYVP